MMVLWRETNTLYLLIVDNTIFSSLGCHWQLYNACMQPCSPLITPQDGRLESAIMLSSQPSLLLTKLLSLQIRDSPAWPAWISAYLTASRRQLSGYRGDELVRTLSALAELDCR